MGLVLVDMARISKIVDQIEKIEKLKRKYGVDINEPVKLGSNILINKEFGKYVVYINNNKWVAINTGISTGMRVITSGVTLGVIKGPFRFLTSDKNAQKSEYIIKICDIIKENIPILENEYKTRSRNAWSV